VRICLANKKGKFYKRLSEPTKRSGGRLAIAKQIIKLAEPLVNKKVVGIGIGSIGPLNLKGGEIVKAPNLPFARIALVKPLSEKFNLPVHLLNDCTTAVWGEKIYGAGKQVKNLVYITLSTGIGGGAIVDDHLLLGKDANAVEIGHMSIDFAGLECSCGGIGHWEAYCSGSNIPRFVRYRLGGKKVKGILKAKEISAKLLFDAAKAGDRIALKIVEEIGMLNAIGFANVINAYDPELITVGGAIALANPKLVLEPIKKYLSDYALNKIPKIRITPLGEDVTLYGAVALVFYLPKAVNLTKKAGA
jgi:glucokinase